MNSNLPEALQRRLDLFIEESGLPKEIVEELISHHTVVTYPKGSTLFLQGAPADVLFWISSGMVEVFCPQEDGSRVLVRLCGPGEILGHVDFIDYKGRRAQMFEAHARVKCEIALLTRDHIRKLLATLEPAQLIHLMEYLNTMWSSVANSWATFIGLDYRQRLEVVLKDLAARFGVTDSRGTLLITELLHAKLAEMIGSSRPMITRLINDMVEQGVLERSGKQYILLNCPDGAANPSARREEQTRASSSARSQAFKSPAMASRTHSAPSSGPQTRGAGAALSANGSLNGRGTVLKS